ncbi:lymphocyte antigen 6E isoform X1 [Gorilla gorilla gorilla]|uniref:lymphocyte antigen 6E isoform X1 n=1 Tax=Gorilla gorilla gorilla TaxID=9595 RepID=UPI00300A1A4C
MAEPQCPSRSQHPQPPTSQPLPVSPPPPEGWPRNSPAWSGKQGQDDLRNPRLRGCLRPPLPSSTPQARPPTLLPDTLRGTPPPCSHPNTSAHPWASHPEHNEDCPGVSDGHADLVPCPASPGQHLPRAQQGRVEGDRAWPWLRRHLAGETGRWSQPPSGPQPPHLSEGAGVGLGGAGTPTAGSPTPPAGGPSRVPPLPPPRGRAAAWEAPGQPRSRAREVRGARPGCWYLRPPGEQDGLLWFVTSRQDGHPLQNEDLLASAAGCPSGCGASQLADVLLLLEPEEQSVLPEADHLLRPGQLLRDRVC